MAATNKAPGTNAAGFELVVNEADGETSVIPLGFGQSTIGSDASCQVLIGDASVAAQHAELLFNKDGTLWLRDIAGQQSTFVNGEATELSQLEDGSFIRVGTVELSVRQRGANSGMHGTMVRDSSAGKLPAIAPSRPSAPPPPAITPLRQSTVQRAFRTSSPGAPPVPPQPMGTVPGIKPQPLPMGALSLEDDPAEPGTDPTFMRGIKPLNEYIGPNTIIAEKYKVISKLAEGGMGEVYKAVHIDLEMQVAIKVMKRELSEDAAFVDRFTREAKAAARIGQQNICAVTDMGRMAGGQFYFVMEYLEGQTLGALIRDRGAIPVSRAIHIFMQLCQALASAHHVDIVHRDLKPENAMILQRPGQQDFVKVLDFGVAKLHKPNESGQTQMGMVVGTPQYMAPEQAMGKATDSRTDIYALGLIFYEMLKGKPTFVEHSAAELMAAQIYRQPPPLTFVNGEPMPDHIQDFVKSLLQKDPEKRPQRLEEVITALHEVQDALGAQIARLATPAYTPPVRPSDIAALLDEQVKAGGTGRPPTAGRLKPPSSSGKHKPPSSVRGKAPPKTPVKPPTIAPLAPVAAAPAALDDGPDYPTVHEIQQNDDLAASGIEKKNGNGLVIGICVGILVLGGAGAAYVLSSKPAPVQTTTIVEIPTTPPPEAVKPPPEPKPAEVKPAEVKPVVAAAPAKLELSLTSDPDGAEVFQDGFSIGKAKMVFSTEPGKPLTLVFKLAGYKDFEKKVLPQGNMAIEAKLVKASAGVTPGTGRPKAKPGKADLADDPYGAKVEELKDAPF